jgi:hypothetical protein
LPPRIIALNQVDLMSALPWRQAVFTTYSLSLSFFEAVVLDAMVRGGGRSALILSDVAGVRAALMEQGARRAGRDYQVEPVAVLKGGVFHPKISALIAEDDCHLLVGSGNLTFGGWGGNLEVCEHLHPSFAADAISDAADFFEWLELENDGRLRHGANDQCAAVASRLRSAARNRPSNGDIRLFHNLNGTISEKLAQAVEDLGGAQQILVAAPFWDGGGAIDRLCKMIGLDEVFVHSHAGGTVEGGADSNWPFASKSKIHAVHLDVLEEREPRRLHAKVFEVICRRGRIVMSGSANASLAALGEGHNVEASVVRIQRETTVGWRFSPAKPPAPTQAPGDQAEAEEIVTGVLRAVLDLGHIVGRVLTPAIAGPATISQITSGSPNSLGKVDIEPDGRFRIPAAELEAAAWSGRRLALRVQADDGRRAEGFISVKAFADVVRRAGAVAPRLMSIITGTETPADVAAIFSWFNEDPKRLVNAAATISGGTHGHAGDGPDDEMIRVDELNPVFGKPTQNNGGSGTGEGLSWRRFMEYVLSAFRERRGPFDPKLEDSDEPDDEPDDKGGKKPPPPPPLGGSDDEKPLKEFEKLLEMMLCSGNAITAFELTRYVCDRLRPPAVKIRGWLESLVDGICHADCPAENQAAVAAAILSLLGAGSVDKPSLRKTRSRLLRIGVDLTGLAPLEEEAFGFLDVIAPEATFAELWSQLGAVRTFAEQIGDYLLAYQENTPIDSNLDFETATPDEWPILHAALGPGPARNRILITQKALASCPKCHIGLPKIEANKLQQFHVATARNCCSRVIVCGE